jgi:DNA (cytosine-5)-methyltransferase 1
LSFGEIRGLQGFPSDWIFKGSKAQIFKQVGNAVPAVFGTVLGHAIREHLSSFPDTPPQALPIPSSFKSYIEYTIRDHDRNADSRQIHKKFTE